MSTAHRAISPWMNPVTRALREGRVCIGACSIGFAGPAVAQVFATAGFSWYYVDMEHGRLSHEGLEHISNASKAAGIVPVAGPPSIGDHLVVRPLDAGAMGVVVPHVETASEVEQIVQWTHYPPIGARGLLPRGVFNNFERVDTVEWIESQNQEVLVAVKVESAAGIDNIDEIASVPGLDAILIGPGDLSLSMGIPGQTGHPDVRDAISKMLRAVKRSGIAGGPHTGRNPKEIAEWVEQGATFMAVTTDSSLLYEISAATVGETKDLLGDRLL